MLSAYYKFSSARVILVKDSKVLLELRDSCEYASNKWMVPGGHTEHGETAIDSAVREMREEVGIVLNKKDLRFVSVVHWWNDKHQKSGITFFWSAHKWEGNVINLEKSKCTELRWFTKEEIDQIDIEITSRKTLDAFFNGKFGKYIQTDWPEAEGDDQEYDCE